MDEFINDFIIPLIILVICVGAIYLIQKHYNDIMSLPSFNPKLACAVDINSWEEFLEYIKDKSFYVYEDRLVAAQNVAKPICCKYHFPHMDLKDEIDKKIQENKALFNIEYKSIFYEQNVLNGKTIHSRLRGEVFTLRKAPLKEYHLKVMLNNNPYDGEMVIKAESPDDAKTEAFNRAKRIMSAFGNKEFPFSCEVVEEKSLLNNGGNK